MIARIIVGMKINTISHTSQPKNKATYILKHPVKSLFIVRFSKLKLLQKAGKLLVSSRL